MSADEQTVRRLHAVQDTPEDDGGDRVITIGACLVLLLIGGLSGFIVGLAASPTIYEWLARSLTWL